ncbi:ATP-dependent DNA helicase Q-like 5 [Galdieria sulphuraria]|nr:ATP-dependent DNA helicase Q-like 5 [Galdieria sulphuraria]
MMAFGFFSVPKGCIHSKQKVCNTVFKDLKPCYIRSTRLSTRIVLLNMSRLNERKSKVTESVEHLLSLAFKQLRDVFGFTEFLSGQEEVLLRLFDCGSALAILPTGGGKSLCYQIPAIIFPGLTLVVSPLIALMREQAQKLVDVGVPAGHMDSLQSTTEIRGLRKSLAEGKVKILFVSPERFNNEVFLSLLRTLEISLFVVDEAHCISEWGHNFRPDYLRLSQFARDCKAAYRLGLTATATERVANDIVQRLNISPEAVVRKNFYRPNLVLNIRCCNNEMEKREELLYCLRQRERGPTLIYVTLQRTAEELAYFLVESGFQARPYHAGLSDEQRISTYDWFVQACNPIVVATIAFGMGVDKPDIRYVYHFNLSKSLEAYSQEIGRAGRDGKKSCCDTFFSGSDIPVLETFIYGNTPDATQISSFLTFLFEKRKKSQVVNLPLYELATNFDMREVVLHTILVFLDVYWGLIKEVTPMFAEYRYQVLSEEGGEEEETLENSLTEQQSILWKNINEQAKKKLKWSYLDLNNLQLGTEIEQVQLLLDKIHSKGFIRLQAGKLQHRIQILKIPQDMKLLQQQLWQLISERESSEVQRLEEMVHLATSTKCVSQAVSDYFGERIEPCHMCERCLGEISAQELSSFDTKSWFASVDMTLWERITKIEELPKEPLTLAKFASGISSPKLRERKITKHELFGSLRECGFQQVLQLAIQYTGQSPISCR